MQMMDCVEVIVEKESYAREGVHKGMQGWICYEQEVELLAGQFPAIR